MIDLKSILKQHPDCLATRSAFKSVLLEKYPAEKRTINIMTSIYECGIANSIKEKGQVSEIDIKKYITQLELDYGTPPQYSRTALDVWVAAYKPNSLLDLTSQAPWRQYIFPIYFLIDSGEHMRGDRIGFINSAMEDFILKWADIDDCFDIRLQIITYGTNARTLFPKPLPLRDVIWSDISTEGACDLGAAINVLTCNIASNFESETGRLYPGMFVAVSGSRCTDRYHEAINNLNANNSPIWRKAVKVGVKIGEDADVEALLAFTQNPELVINANKIGVIERLVRYDDSLFDYDY